MVPMRRITCKGLKGPRTIPRDQPKGLQGVPKNGPSKLPDGLDVKAAARHATST